MMRVWMTIALAAAMPTDRLPGQTRTAATAAMSITERDIRRRIDLIAADSMLGRATPSRELDRTAAYLAKEFRRFGLRTTVQRYPLHRRRLLPGRSTIAIAGPSGTVTLSLGADAAFMQGIVPDRPVGGPLVILGGEIDPAGIVPDSLTGRSVLWLADFSSEAAAARADAIGATLIKGKAALVLVAPSDPSLLASLQTAQTTERVSPVGSTGLDFTVVAVSESTLARRLPALAPRLAAIRATTHTVVESEPSFTAVAALVDSTVGTATAPNVIGLLPGRRGPAAELVAFSAHFDHLGVAAGNPVDSIFNGADDNGSGTVGLLELAEAFSRGPRQARSLLFVAVSGEEKGLWGSGYFTKHPTVPLDRIVADVNIDMIGRNWTDTVGVIGREHSDLGDVLDRVAARHPELRMTPIGDAWPTEGRFYRSDHYNFARAGVPILFLSSGYSPDYHQPTDSPDKIDAEKEARLVRLIYWFGLELASQVERPIWNPASRRAIVERP